MAQGYRQLKTTVAQTAANDAASIVAAVAAGASLNADEFVDLFEDIFDGIFAKLSPIVDEDNKMLVEQEGTKTSAAPRASSRSKKTGGGSRARSSSNGTPSLDEALAFRLNWGAFGNDGEPGLSFGEVLELTAEEADSEYGYGEGVKDGRDYIAWASSVFNKNDTQRPYAAVVAADAGIDPLQPRD